MKVLILGNDGYIGYPLTIHLLKLGHEVAGVDNFSRRHRVCEVGSESLTPIASPEERHSWLTNRFPNFIGQSDVNLSHGRHIQLILKLKPDAIIHLAEQPSAPWSMKDAQCAMDTQLENVIGTLNLLWAMKEECPEAHLIKLGTMGEYGTPECDIPEGVIPNKPCAWTRDSGIYKDINDRGSAVIGLSRKCPMSGLLFPRTPGSFYHLSKVHDTLNIHFACRNWGLCSTDIMQGVLFGLEGDSDIELTRFDYDDYFGTAINRFCVQAIIKHPLTIYGRGHQKRGFLPLKDSLQCITIALENSPKLGEYRTLNQFENVYSINYLATLVHIVATIDLNLDVQPVSIPNPRLEAEDHYYNPSHQTLFDLGYKPTTNIRGEIATLMEKILPYKDRIRHHVILPRTNWK